MVRKMPFDYERARAALKKLDANPAVEQGVRRNCPQTGAVPSTLLLAGARGGEMFSSLASEVAAVIWTALPVAE